MDCSHNTFFSDISIQSKCNIAEQYCDDYFDIANFFSFAYCYLNGQLIYFFLLSIIYLINYGRQNNIQTKFNIKEQVAPAITYIVEKFELPDSIAAVTLVAFTNGAGDFVAAMVASGSQDGLCFTIGAIYGAGLYVQAFVIGLIIINFNSSIHIKLSELFKTLGLYVIATLWIGAFAATGKLTIVTSVCMLALYIGLIVYQKKEKSRVHQNIERLNSSFNPITQINQSYNSSTMAQSVSNDSSSQIQSDTKLNSKILAEKTKETTQLKENAEQPLILVQEDEQENFSTVDKIFKILDMPASFLLYLTFPHAHNQTYNVYRYVSFPLFASLMLFYFHTQDIHYMIYLEFVLGPVILVMILLLVSTLQKKRKEQPMGYLFLQFIIIYIGLAWSFLATNVIVDLLQTIGMFSNLEGSYLGLTIISVGNSLPDTFTSVSLAKQGQAELGVIGAQSSQLFSLLVGFGVPLLKLTIQGGGSTVIDLEKHVIDLMIMIVSSTILLGTLIYQYFKNGVYEKKMGYILIGSYLFAILMITAYTIFTTYIQ